eukprot:TRINITY_DN44777_c0_g1_i1.p1 TRINITY_DN44777_c0_g1~~TRINITY_DN44777_c0_g1_i1.p1  ORF type:complete len:474 (+),score=75.82 TRINITY_DN44777_c0_g1_i1:58-1422(+)
MAASTATRSASPSAGSVALPAGSLAAAARGVASWRSPPRRSASLSPPPAQCPTSSRMPGRRLGPAGGSMTVPGSGQQGVPAVHVAASVGQRQRLPAPPSWVSNRSSRGWVRSYGSAPAPTVETAVVREAAPLSSARGYGTSAPSSPLVAPAPSAGHRGPPTRPVPSSSPGPVPLRRSLMGVSGARGMRSSGYSLVAAARASSSLASSLAQVRAVAGASPGMSARAGPSAAVATFDSVAVPSEPAPNTETADGESLQEASLEEGTETATTTAGVAAAVQSPRQAFANMLEEVDDFGAEGSSCAICLGSEHAGDVAELKCGNRHRFHKSCISTWMVASVALNNGVPRCPLCRQRLNTGDAAGGTQAGAVRRDVLDLSLQELAAVERLLEEVRTAVLERRVAIASSPGQETSDQGGQTQSAPWPQLRAAQARTLMLEDQVAELRSAVFELQSRLSLL